VKTCPRCTLVSPDNAVHCDCGFQFGTASPEAVKAELASAQLSAIRGAMKGLFVGLGAVAVSVLTYVFAKPGGRYFIYYGAAIAGLALACKSLVRIVDIRNARKQLNKSDFKV